MREFLTVVIGLILVCIAFSFVFNGHGCVTLLHDHAVVEPWKKLLDAKKRAIDDLKKQEKEKDRAHKREMKEYRREIKDRKKELEELQKQKTQGVFQYRDPKTLGSRSAYPHSLTRPFIPSTSRTP